mmetsp:Transcript_5765/g.14778  ORF Transcript_5765/g.14778 Transcript_5765/m.14778 type:complete len:552 (-) Transcript_5765:357-2012(-)
MMTTNVRNMRSIVTASSAVLVALLAVVVMLSAVSGVSADKSTTTTYETTKYVDEYNSGYYGDEYKSGYYPKYKWWAPWTWKYSSNKYNDNKYDSGYDSGYSKYDSGYGYSKYDSKYGVGPYYGKQYEQDEHYPCDTFYPKPKWYSPFTWKYRKYAKFDYYSGPCEVKKEEHCLPFWGHPDDASEATWYTVTHASGGGGCHGDGCSIIGDPIGPIIGGDGGDAGGDGRRRQLLELSYPRPLYETQYFYAKSEAHGLTFTLTNHYYYNEKWVCAIDDISRKNAICTMAGRFGGGYSTPEKCILTFKTHQKGGKCIPHHMALDCGKPPYVETSKFSKIDYRDIPHKDIIQQDLEGCTCDSSDNFLSGTAYTNCQSEPFGGAPITLDNIAMDPALSDNTGSVTVVSFPCVTESFQSVVLQDFGNTFSSLEEVRFANWVTGHSKFSELKDNIMSYWQRQIKSDEPAKEKTPDDEVHKAAARAAAIALAAKDVGTQQLNRRTFCKSCNQHVTDHTTITCPRGNGSGSRQCVHRRQQQPRIPRREPQEAGDWIVAPEF